MPLRAVLYSTEMSRWSRRRIVAIATVALLAGLAPLAKRSLEQRLIYFPDRAVTDTPARYGLSFQDVWATTSDGVRVHGWAMAPEGVARAWLLYSHGNAGNVSVRPSGVAPLVRDGLGVLLYDYRGYGRSEGSPTEQGTYRDGEAMLAQASRLAAGPGRVFLYGVSLGGGVSYELAARHPEVAGLITDATFTSIPAMARELYPVPGLSWAVSTRYDNLGKAPLVRVPRLVMHGTADELIPFSMGIALRDATSPPAEFLAIRGAHHNDTQKTGGDEYYGAIRRFVDKCLATPR